MSGKKSSELVTTHQCELVSIRMILEVFWNVTMAEKRRDQTGRLRSVEIKGDAQELRDIWVVEGGPNAHFSDEFLMEDKKDKARSYSVKMRSHPAHRRLLESFDNLDRDLRECRPKLQRMPTSK